MVLRPRGEVAGEVMHPVYTTFPHGNYLFRMATIYDVTSTLLRITIHYFLRSGSIRCRFPPPTSGGGNRWCCRDYWWNSINRP